jgi:hypothetical protein
MNLPLSFYVLYIIIFLAFQRVNVNFTNNTTHHTECYDNVNMVCWQVTRYGWMTK